VEKNHRSRDVSLESLPSEEPFAALAGNDGGDSLILQPGEQPSQLGAENPVVLQSREQRSDAVEHAPFGPARADRRGEPAEQPPEIVLTGLLDLGAFPAYVVNRQLL